MTLKRLVFALFRSDNIQALTCTGNIDDFCVALSSFLKRKFEWGRKNEDHSNTKKENV